MILKIIFKDGNKITVDLQHYYFTNDDTGIYLRSKDNTTEAFIPYSSILYYIKKNKKKGGDE
ncbi:MAG: aminoglycoside 6-adenylyltransferase [Candidatus Omnitrophica bacterium]|nr:aminoglycoside 6-adenylyltransferase [Candidatus Omnitrophota bacterium]